MNVGRSSYHETTVTNTHEIANGHEWATATTIDTGKAGKLSFVFIIRNTGTDIARDIQDLRFNIYIGNNKIGCKFLF